jgi:hypothetical protein
MEFGLMLLKMIVLINQELNLLILANVPFDYLT